MIAQKEKGINEKRRHSSKKTDITEIEEIFRQTTRINMQIETKKEEILYWRNLSTSTQAVLSAANTGGAKKNRSRVEDCVCKITDIEESLNGDMEKLISLKAKVMRIIDQIDIPEYKSLLTHRYICDKTWYEVADSMGYSYVHTVNRLHPKALKRICEIGIGVEE